MEGSTVIEQGITYCHHHHNQTSSPPLNTDIVHTSLPSVRVHALLSFRDSVVNVRCLCRDVRGSLCRVHSSTSFLPFLEFHQLLRFSPGARHSFQFRAHSRALPPPPALSPFSAQTSASGNFSRHRGWKALFSLQFLAYASFTLNLAGSGLMNLRKCVYSVFIGNDERFFISNKKSYRSYRFNNVLIVNDI